MPLKLDQPVDEVFNKNETPFLYSSSTSMLWGRRPAQLMMTMASRKLAFSTWASVDAARVRIDDKEVLFCINGHTSETNAKI